MAMYHEPLINSVCSKQGTRFDPLSTFNSFHEPFRTRSILSSTINLTKCAIGAGILGFPYAFHQTGIIAGIALSIIMGSLSYFTLLMLVNVCPIDRPIHSYQDLVAYHLPPWAGKLISISIISLVDGVCIVYLINIGETLWHIGHDATPDPGYVRVAIVFFSVVVILPLCLFRDIGTLSVTSGLAVLGAVVLTICIVESGVSELVDDDTSDSQVGSNEPNSTSCHDSDMRDESEMHYSIYGGILTRFRALPVLSFAFQAHFVCIPVYYELSEPSPQRMARISLMTTIICLVVYIVVGTFGYLDRGSAVKNDILASYCKDNIPILIARIGNIVNLALTYPVMFFTARLAILDLFFSEKEDFKTFYLVTLANFVLTVILALFIPFRAVFSLIGAMPSTFVMYILPPILTLRIPNLSIKERIVAHLVLFAGCFIGLAGTAATFYSSF